MRLVAIATIAACLCWGQSAPPWYAATNFAVDLSGTADSRSGTYGTTGVATWNLTFFPPPGARVRILSIEGDLVGWVRSLPGDPPTVPESTAGVTFNIQSNPSVSAYSNSGRCDPCSDGRVSMAYLQAVVTPLQPSFRAAFSRPDVGVVLGPDNALLITCATWLNTTGKPVHLEPTFTVKYKWEDRR